MEINDIIFRYKDVKLILTAKAKRTFRLNAFKGDVLLGEIKWSFVYNKYKLFRIKNIDVSDEDWDFIKYCMNKLNEKFYGKDEWAKLSTFRGY